MGERIGLDVLNTIYDTSTAIVDQHMDDFEGFKLELFKTFAMESPFTEEEFKGMKQEQLTDKLFNEALQNYKRRMERTFFVLANKLQLQLSLSFRPVQRQLTRRFFLRTK